MNVLMTNLFYSLSFVIDVFFICMREREKNRAYFLMYCVSFQEKITNVFLAVQDGDEEATEKLLEGQPQLASSKNNHGHTLLHIAVLFDNISAVKLILEINPETTNIPDNVSTNS